MKKKLSKLWEYAKWILLPFVYLFYFTVVIIDRIALIPMIHMNVPSVNELSELPSEKKHFHIRIFVYLSIIIAVTTIYFIIKINLNAWQTLRIIL